MLERESFFLSKSFKQIRIQWLYLGYITIYILKTKCSNIALYPVTIYKLAALYIIIISTSKSAWQPTTSTCTINASINIKMTKKSAEPSCSVFFEVGLSDLKLHLPVGNCSNQSEMELENKQELPSRLLGMDGWHRFYAFKIHLEVLINWSTVIHQFSLAAILKPRAIFHFSQLVSYTVAFVLSNVWSVLLIGMPFSPGMHFYRFRCRTFHLY